MLDNKNFHSIINEICKELDIKVEKLSYGWILKLTKDDKVRYIVGNNFSLNLEASSIIIRDKCATYEVLNSFGIPAVKHKILFNPRDRADYVPKEGNDFVIENEFLKYSKLVVKPNTGFEGNGVTLCHTLDEALVAKDKLFKTNTSISICPYYDIDKEYRVFYLNGNAELIYGKEKPYVIGDGKSTLKELISKIDLPKKDVVTENLSLLDLSNIPNLGQKVEVSWKYNLSGGAKPFVVERNSEEEKELYDRILELALKAGKATNIGFATIDIIRTKDDNLYVLEINAGVSTNIFAQTVEGGRKIIKCIFKKALKNMFNEALKP